MEIMEYDLVEAVFFKYRFPTKEKATRGGDRGGRYFYSVCTVGDFLHTTIFEIFQIV